MANLPAIVLQNWTAGYVDAGSGLGTPQNGLQLLENCYVNRKSIYSRKGAEQLLSNAVWGENPIQELHLYEDNDLNRYLIIAVNGGLYRYDFDAGTPTAITGSLTLSTSAEAVFQFVNYNGKCYGTDGVNPPFVIEDATSNAVLLSASSDSAPTRASAVAIFKEQMFWGNYTDVFDSVSKKYGVIHSDIGDPTLYDASQGARNNLNRNRHVRALADHDDDVLLIYQNKGIWSVRFAPANALGQARTNFAYDRVSYRVGLASERGYSNSQEGTFHVDVDGFYWMPPGPPQKPVYVGTPVEDFWDQVNKAKLNIVTATEMPELNGVVFSVPFGTDQATNNRLVYLNYTSWSQFSAEQDSRHPAFAIWGGYTTDVFSFNALETVIDTDSRYRVLAGDYKGFVYTLGETELDTFNANQYNIRARFRTPIVGDPGRELHWDNLILDADLDDVKVLSVTQRNYDRPTAAVNQVTSGTSGAVLDEFVLDTDSLLDDSSGPIRLDMYGQSRYTELTFEVLEGVPFAAHKLTIHYEPGSTL